MKGSAGAKGSPAEEDKELEGKKKKKKRSLGEKLYGKKEQDEERMEAGE